jgi:transposase
LGGPLSLVEPMMEAIQAFGADPVIPFREIYSATRLPKSELTLRFYKQFLADPEAFFGRYRYRPLIESGISALKRKFSEALKSRDWVARVNEVLYKVLCHNIDCLIHAAIEHGLNVGLMLCDDPIEELKRAAV